MLYHLSFNANLAGVLTPKYPDTDDHVTKSHSYSEINLPPRVCFSTSIQGCFSAIYPNISHYFEEHNYPYMDMYVYVGIETKDTRRLDRKTLHQYVWDSQITNEVAIIDPITVRLYQKIRVRCTDKEIFCHPFGKNSEPLKFVSPTINYRVLKQY